MDISDLRSRCVDCLRFAMLSMDNTDSLERSAVIVKLCCNDAKESGEFGYYFVPIYWSFCIHLRVIFLVWSALGPFETISIANISDGAFFSHFYDTHHLGLRDAPRNILYR